MISLDEGGQWKTYWKTSIFKEYPPACCVPLDDLWKMPRNLRGWPNCAKLVPAQFDEAAARGPDFCCERSLTACIFNYSIIVAQRPQTHSLGVHKGKGTAVYSKNLSKGFAQLHVNPFFRASSRSPTRGWPRRPRVASRSPRRPGNVLRICNQTYTWTILSGCRSCTGMWDVVGFQSPGWSWEGPARITVKSPNVHGWSSLHMTMRTFQGTLRLFECTPFGA